MRNNPLALTLVALLAVSSFACSPDLPPALKAVPAGTDIVGSIDAKATLGYVKKTLPKIVPDKLKGKIPSFTEIAKQAMLLAGLDVEKLTTVHFFGDISGHSFALVAEGMTTGGLKGKSSGKYKNLDIYSLLGGTSYAELKPLGLVVASDEVMLRKVIDTFRGDAKRLTDTDKGKLVKKMLKIHKDMDLIRLYVLDGKLPELPMGMSIKLDGGGFFMNLDKGVAITVLTDKQASDKIAQAVGVGLMSTQAMLMMGGGKDMPVTLDDEAKKVFTNFLGKVKTAKKESGVTISFQGDLKPIIEKTLALGARSYAQRPIPLPAVGADQGKKDAIKKQPVDISHDAEASPKAPAEPMLHKAQPDTSK